MINFKRIALLTLALSLCLVLLSTCANDQRQHSSAYLEAAIEVGHWMISQADRNGDIPDKASPDSIYSSGLGSGASGRALFFL